MGVVIWAKDSFRLQGFCVSPKDGISVDEGEMNIVNGCYQKKRIKDTITYVYLGEATNLLEVPVGIWVRGHFQKHK